MMRETPLFTLFLMSWLVCSLSAQKVDSPHGDLKLACEQCHSTAGWSDPTKFGNYRHRYQPMEGAHASMECKACHLSGDFAEVGKACVDCHLDIHQGQLGGDCADCHDTTSWAMGMMMRQRHEQTAFPLLGAHAQIGCDSCHGLGSSEEWSRLSPDCESCHTPDFERTTNPNHEAAQFLRDCRQCHALYDTDWRVPNYVHPGGFSLTGGHAGQDCIACHSGGYAGISTECISCHEADFNGTRDPNHRAQAFPTDCTSCHGTGSWTPATFDHNQTGFPLVGGHQLNDCASCHSGGFNNTPTDCVSCHRTDYDATRNPDHAAARFPTSCESCHTTLGWEPAQFDHSRTSFPLTGAHQLTDCLACHSVGYENTPNECAACHQGDYDATRDPHHTPDRFPSTCESCHTTNGWEPATFDHNLTNFPLTGGHNLSDCLACHATGYTNTSSECVSCHRADYDGTTDPNHRASNFPLSCESCHTTQGWEPASFDHSQTAFPLTGGHNLSDCLACHSAGYTNTPTNCAACHQEDYDGTTDPNHRAANFPLSCESCHTTQGWEPASFDHSQTAFPLTGGHNLSDCLACHSAGYTNTPTNCAACHQEDYDGTTDPNHRASNFPLSCESCHTTQGWEPASFDHNQTAFPLTGGHQLNDCLACHSTGYTNTPTNCAACHQEDYDAVTDPNHRASNFPLSCESCHTTQGWEPASFDHNQTAFPLTGGHQLNDCLACHSTGYTNTPTNCAACHQDDYDAVTDPNHRASNFPLSCESCHTTRGWEPASFDHNQTAFPLTGGHQLNDCLACHSTGYTNTPTNCAACHQDDYDAVLDPNHRTGNFPLSCESCHTTQGWEPASFNHNQTSFPLTGGHQISDCLACHSQGYNNTPTECLACHQLDYNGAEPNHVTAGFPTDCLICHDTRGWSGATFNHSFPIYSGSHRGEWNTCSECHQTSSNYGIFTCLTCHEHNQQEMDEEHQGIQGYAYQSQSCYNCHPNGEEE